MNFERATQLPLAGTQRGLGRSLGVLLVQAKQQAINPLQKPLDDAEARIAELESKDSVQRRELRKVREELATTQDALARAELALSYYRGKVRTPAREHTPMSVVKNMVGGDRPFTLLRTIDKLTHGPEKKDLSVL